MIVVNWLKIIEYSRSGGLLCNNTCFLSFLDNSLYDLNANVRRRDMMKFEVKLRCCSSVAIRMLYATMEAIKEKSTFGYD